jgi:hypothetical protein
MALRFGASAAWTRTRKAARHPCRDMTFSVCSVAGCWLALVEPLRTIRQPGPFLLDRGEFPRAELC